MDTVAVTVAVIVVVRQTTRDEICNGRAYIGMRETEQGTEQSLSVRQRRPHPVYPGRDDDEIPHQE